MSVVIGPSTPSNHQIEDHQGHWPNPPACGQDCGYHLEAYDCRRLTFTANRASIRWLQLSRPGQLLPASRTWTSKRGCSGSGSFRCFRGDSIPLLSRALSINSTQCILTTVSDDRHRCGSSPSPDSMDSEQQRPAQRNLSWSAYLLCGLLVLRVYREGIHTTHE